MNQLSTWWPGYQGGFHSPDAKFFAVNIPKNASSYLSGLLDHNGWTSAKLGEITIAREIEKVVVVLRDPVDRWVSGIVQFIITRILSTHGPNGPIYPNELVTEHDASITAQQFIDQYNSVVERLLFDRLGNHDDHVWPQHEFFEWVLPSIDRLYIMLDGDFEKNLQRHLSLDMVPDLDRNDGGATPHGRMLKEFFKQRLIHRPELVDRIKKFYSKDYEIINQINA